MVPRGGPVGHVGVGGAVRAPDHGPSTEAEVVGPGISHRPSALTAPDPDDADEPDRGKHGVRSRRRRQGAPWLGPVSDASARFTPSIRTFRSGRPGGRTTGQTQPVDLADHGVAGDAVAEATGDLAGADALAPQLPERLDAVGGPGDGGCRHDWLRGVREPHRLAPVRPSVRLRVRDRHPQGGDPARGSGSRRRVEPDPAGRPGHAQIRTEARSGSSLNPAARQEPADDIVGRRRRARTAGFRPRGARQPAGLHKAIPLKTRAPRSDRKGPAGGRRGPGCSTCFDARTGSRRRERPRRPAPGQGPRRPPRRALGPRRPAPSWP
jgi:hypothetical protein